MEEKKPGRMEKFLSGKGFAIVLVLCMAVIGLSAWSIIGGSPISSGTNNNEITLDEPAQPVRDKTPEPEKEHAVAPEVRTDGIKDVIEPISEELEEVISMESGNVYTEPEIWLWPVIGELERAYTVEALAYDVTMSDWRTHDGIDIAAQLGAVVRAAAAGVVESVKQDELYGTTVIIDHGNGVKTVYANLADTPTVSAGDEVRAGDISGSVGETALCEIGEPGHLHFAVSANGVSADPLDYLPE